MSDSGIRLIDPRTGRAYAAADEPSVVLSSARTGWSPSFLFEVHRMAPHAYDEHVLVGHRLIVNLGEPVRFRWKNGDRTQEDVLSTGAFCLQTEGDLNAPFWQDDMTFAALAIAPELVTRLLEDRAPRATATFAERRCQPEPTAHGYVRALAAELSSPSEPTYAEALGHAFTLHLLSAHGLADGAKRLAPKGKLGAGQLRTAVDLAHARLSEGVALEELAGAAGYSPFHFARLFKATTGVAPHQYLLRLRLERAQRLIRSGLGLAESALASGFYDQAHMTNVFRKSLGLTPASLQSR